jgi:hypothetical protein
LILKNYIIDKSAEDDSKVKISAMFFESLGLRGLHDNGNYIHWGGCFDF